MTNQQRTPKGTPSGGQFSGTAHRESDVSLGACIITADNIGTEDDCTTHDHEPLRPAMTPATSDEDGRETRTEDQHGTRTVSHLLRGNLDDPADGTPAVRRFNPDGTLLSEEHYRNGGRQDPADGTPAERWYANSGNVMVEIHYQNGFIQDPADGTPAERRYYDDGSVMLTKSYRGGRHTSPRLDPAQA